jgi:hypothetical protein
MLPNAQSTDAASSTVSPPSSQCATTPLAMQRFAEEVAPELRNRIASVRG